MTPNKKRLAINAMMGVLCLGFFLPVSGSWVDVLRILGVFLAGAAVGRYLERYPPV